jgi:DNA-binding NarL/FixJ family response regulator
MQVVGRETRCKRLVVVADESLIVEAMALGLRNSGEFEFAGHINAWTGEFPPVFESVLDVVLFDEMEPRGEVVTLIGQIKAGHPEVAVLVLTSSMVPEWLDALFAAGALGAISKSTHPGGSRRWSARPSMGTSSKSTAARSPRMAQL